MEYWHSSPLTVTINYLGISACIEATILLSMGNPSSCGTLSLCWALNSARDLKLLSTICKLCSVAIISPSVTGSLLEFFLEIWFERTLMMLTACMIEERSIDHFVSWNLFKIGRRKNDLVFEGFDRQRKS